MSIYTNESDCVTGTVAVYDGRQLPEWSDGLRLYAHPDSSLPPLEAVFRFGSAELNQWRGEQLGPRVGFNDNFRTGSQSTPTSAGTNASYRSTTKLHAVLGLAHAVA